MRKHTLYGLVLLTLVLAALVLVLNAHPFGSKPARLSSLMVSASAYDALPEGRSEDPSLLQGLSCNDFSLPAASNAFYYSMIEGDPFALDPLVAAQGSQTLCIAFCEELLDEAFLRRGEGLRFTVYTDTAYAHGTMHLTTLPTVCITVTQPDDAGSYEIYDRMERAATMTLFDNRDAIPNRARIVRSDTSIRIRGASSAQVPKKSYRLSLNTLSLGENLRQNPQSLLGMRSDEDWILYSPTSDAERIRNSFFNNLWYQTGAQNNSLNVTLGVECRYVELVLNGQYMGLYSLMYPLDEKQVSLPKEGFYYRGISYEGTTPEQLRQAGDAVVVGGWEYRGSFKSSAKGAERWECLCRYIENITYYSAGDEPEWYAANFDEDNIIDHHLFLSMIQGEDNYYKNNNIIVYPMPEGGYRYLLAPWDLDLTWGSRHDFESEWRIGNDRLQPEKEFHALWSLPGDRMAHLSADFRANMLARWRELRAGPWSDAALMAQMDAYEEEIFGSGAMARDHSRWPTAPAADDLGLFREYGLARLAFLDSYFEEAMKE